MSMLKISVDEAQKICEKFGSKPCKVEGTDVVQIRGKTSKSDRYVDISWAEFESALKKRKLSVYKSEKGNFLKIMKNK
jgi:hypothetical protein